MPLDFSSGPDGSAVPQTADGINIPPPRPAVPTPPARPAPRPELRVVAGTESEGGEGQPAAAEDDFDEDENNVSLAMMESALKPQILEKLDVIYNTYKKLGRL